MCRIWWHEPIPLDLSVLAFSSRPNASIEVAIVMSTSTWMVMMTQVPPFTCHSLTRCIFFDAGDKWVLSAGGIKPTELLLWRVRNGFADEELEALATKQRKLAFARVMSSGESPMARSPAAFERVGSGEKARMKRIATTVGALHVTLLSDSTCCFLLCAVSFAKCGCTELHTCILVRRFGQL